MPGTFRSLIPAGPDCDALGALDGWREQRAPADRPRVALNMVASVDGRATIDGRSGPLSSPPDRELFHALRARSDAVMAGATTIQAERYGPTIRDGGLRARRREWGLVEQPPAVIASRSLDLDPALPLLADPDSHVIVIGPSVGTIDGARARVEYVRCPTFAQGLAELGDRFGIALVICEGGPTLAGMLAREGLVDELFLAHSPQLVGGEPGLTIVSGGGSASPRPLRLERLLAHGDELYTHYVFA